jgi:arylsulfatase A-like enzyme
MLRQPGETASTRIETRVSLVDLVPTILDIAGVAPDGKLRGQVLGDSVAVRPVYAQGSEWRSMNYMDEKWIIEISEETRLPEPRYRYNLAKDPGEVTQRLWASTDEAMAFFRLTANDPDPGGIPEDFVEGMRIDAPKVRPGLDAATMKKLRSLGYVR